MSMHVLFIAKAFNNSYNKVSGIFVKEQAAAVSKQGFETGMIAVNFVSWLDILKSFRFDFGFREYNHAGVRAMVFQTPVWPRFRWINYKRRDRMLRKLSELYFKKHGKPDIVHLHGFYCGKEAIRLKDKYRIPFITTEHYSVFAQNMVRKFEENIATLTYSESSYRIAVSKTFADYLSKRSGYEFNYLPNIVDVSRFMIKPPKQNPHAKTILNVGKLDRNKNQELLLQAFALVKSAGVNLLVAGNGPYLKRLKKTASRLGISERVVFAGYVPNENLEPLYHQADLLVVVSRYETFGIVMIEAMCCGTPVVSTPVGAAKDILVDERLGTVCEPDPRDIARCMEKYLNNEPDKDFIHNFADSEFSSENVSSKLIDIYQRICYGSI